MFMKKVLIILTILFCGLVVSAQMARKPSPKREPKGAMPAVPDSTKRSLPQVKSQEDFDSIARTYHQGTPFALPHAMFVIDRKNKNKVYYINSQRYRFHKDFLLANYLVPRGGDIYKPIYVDQNRRYIVGTIAWQKPVEKFTWELWEGDMASGEIIKTAHATITPRTCGRVRGSSFITRISYEPTSTVSSSFSMICIRPMAVPVLSARYSWLAAISLCETSGMFRPAEASSCRIEFGLYDTG